MALFARFGASHDEKAAPPARSAGAEPKQDTQPVSHDVRPTVSAEAIASDKRERMISTKIEIHQVLLETLNLHLLDSVPRETLREQIDPVIAQEVRNRALALNRSEYLAFVEEIIDEMVGLGPLEALLKDDTISDILINTHEHIFVERFGKLEPTAVRFRDEPHLLRVINKIVSAVGRRVDESVPLCDARLQDGSRINVAVRPITVDGPAVSIRKFAKKKLSLERMVEGGTLRGPMAEVLAKACWGKVTIIVSGGTGSGKTTMLNALSSAISPSERLVTIEDAAELQLQQPHVVRMETRPPNLEGKGEIRQRELVMNALRMRPDRIILGEIRGGEAFDMLQAMNTGHEGSLATVHANTPRDALARIEQMVTMSGLPISQASIRNQIASALHVIVQLNRLSDGKRKIVSVSEITGMEGDIIQMQEIFAFKRTGTGPDGAVLGEFRATGVRPRFAEELMTRGVVFPSSYFDPGKPL
jgi:pilus assembly protein CpaF